MISSSALYQTVIISLQLAAASAELVTVCQALHWMQVDSFYQEAARVLRPGGLLAVLGYHFSSPGPGVANAVKVDF